MNQAQKSCKKNHLENKKKICRVIHKDFMKAGSKDMKLIEMIHDHAQW
jgi:hypothetical protein